MAMNFGTFNSTQLTGSGLVTSSISGATLFDFRNNGNSAYFIMEDNGRLSGSLDYTASIGFISGSYSSSQIPNFSTSSAHLMGVVVPSKNDHKFLGTGSFLFTPSDNTTSGSIRLRAAGDFTVTIT